MHDGINVLEGQLAGDVITIFGVARLLLSISMSAKVEEPQPALRRVRPPRPVQLVHLRRWQLPPLVRGGPRAYVVSG